MMKIQVKKLVGTKWRPLKIDELVGTSILNFILASDDAIIAAIFDENDVPVAFVSNNMEHLERYELQGKLCLDAETLKELIGTDVALPLIARMFPGSALVGVGHEPSKEQE